MPSASTVCHSKSREVASCLVTPLKEALYSFTKSSSISLHQYSCCCKRGIIFDLIKGQDIPSAVAGFHIGRTHRDAPDSNNLLKQASLRLKGMTLPYLLQQFKVPFTSLYKTGSGLTLYLIHYITENNTLEVFQGSRTLREIQASVADTGTNPILPAKKKFCSGTQQDSWECSLAPWGTSISISTHIITHFVLSVVHYSAVSSYLCGFLPKGRVE